MNKDMHDKLYEKYGELIDSATGKNSELLNETGLGERTTLTESQNTQDVLEWIEGEFDSPDAHLREAMDPEKARGVIANMERGRSQCASKHKGNPAKIKGCQDRLGRIIAGIKKKHNL